MAKEKSLVQRLIEENLETKNPELDLTSRGLRDNSPGLELLERCQHLKKLELGNFWQYQQKKDEEALNNLTAIPRNLPDSLTSLNFIGNQIQKIENLDQLKNLTKLGLRANQIQKIENLDQLKNLTELDLDYNQIQKIENLDQLKNLTALYLYANQVQKIENLDQLKNLTALYLYANQVQKIENLDQLKNLTKLGLSTNQIQKIENLDQLKNLTELYLVNNQIQKIENLDQLKNLTKLGLSTNQIRKIDNLDQLKNLTELDLRSNQIQKIDNLPVPLLKKLDTIRLTGNPVEETLVLADINNTDVLLGYLQSQKSKDQKLPNKHLKINILGTGRLGKTQLFCELTEEKYTEELALPTHGMNTALYKTSDDYEAMLWDFGGQEYHHGTHALFLRRKDLNIVLWRNNESDGQYAYWLGTTRYFSPVTDNWHPSVLLVQNVWENEEDKIAHPDSERLEKYAIHPDDIFNINTEETNSGNSTWAKKWKQFKSVLDDRIREYADKLGEVPASFAEARKRLLKEPLKEINYSLAQFKDEYAQGIPNEQFSYFVDYLEFSGCVLYFYEISELRPYVFPDPVRLSEWIYKEVLSEKLLKKQNGAFELNDLKVDKKQLDTFLKLAEHFQLFFTREKEDGKQQYIVPQYLPENDSSFKRIILELLPYTFCLHFPDFMHAGRFFTFMSLYGQYAIDDTAYWKYGLLFEHPEHGLRTLVYYKAINREIIVHIEDGKNRSDVARELFDYFAFPEPILATHLLLKKKEELEEKERNKLVHGTYNRNRKEWLERTDALLSTNHRHFIPVTETAKNVEANFLFGECQRTGKRIKLDFIAQNLLSDNTDRKLRIFVSYSHEDESYRKELDSHFAFLRRTQRIETWSDRMIIAGDKWDDQIKLQLEQADIVLLLLSADFFNSEYIQNEELRIIRQRLDDGDFFKVIPIPIRPCDVQESDLMALQSASPDFKWVATAPNKDQIYMEIVREIRKTIQSMR